MVLLQLFIGNRDPQKISLFYLKEELGVEVLNLAIVDL